MGSMPAKWDATYKQYRAKVHTFARNSYYTIPGFAVEDMEQELLEVLWQCVFDYHPRHGATFNTFFQQSARNKISSLIRACETQKRKADIVSLDDDDIRTAIEEVFTDESPESTVLRRMEIREYVAAEGMSGLRQLLHTEGMSALEAS